MFSENSSLISGVAYPDSPSLRWIFCGKKHVYLLYIHQWKCVASHLGVSLSKFVGFRIVKCNNGKKSLRPVCFLFRHYTLQLLNQEATVHLFWTLVSFNESKTNRADNHYIAGNDFQDYSPSYSQKRLVCNFSSEYPIHCSTDGENTQIINQRILYWFRPKFS